MIYSMFKSAPWTFVYECHRQPSAVIHSLHCRCSLGTVSAMQVLPPGLEVLALHEEVRGLGGVPHQVRVISAPPCNGQTELFFFAYHILEWA